MYRSHPAVDGYLLSIHHHEAIFPAPAEGLAMRSVVVPSSGQRIGFLLDRQQDHTQSRLPHQLARASFWQRQNLDHRQHKLHGRGSSRQPTAASAGAHGPLQYGMVSSLATLLSMLGNIAQRLPRLWARVANLNELPGNFRIVAHSHFSWLMQRWPVWQGRPVVPHGHS